MHAIIANLEHNKWMLKKLLMYACKQQPKDIKAETTNQSSIIAETEKYKLSLEIVKYCLHSYISLVFIITLLKF